MAKPRRIVPGATHMLTRRAYQRTFRMRPHPVTNQIALYCLAVAAAKYGMHHEVHRLREQVRKQGLGFLAVMAKSFLQKAMSYEAKRGINPVLAARDVSVRSAMKRLRD